MHKLFFLLFFILGTTLNLDAQVKKGEYGLFDAGIIAGGCFSQIDGDGVAGYHKFGFNAGGRVHVNFSERIAGTLELLFVQRGSYSSFNGLRYQLNYVDIPVLFTYKDWFVQKGETNFARVAVSGGLSYGRLVGGALSPNASMSIDELKKYDLSGVLDFSVRITSNIGLGLTFSKSFLSIYDDPKTQNREVVLSNSIWLRLFYML